MKNPRNKQDTTKRVWLRFALKALALALPFLLLVVLVNYTADPGRLYHIGTETSPEFEIVRLVQQGNNVENIGNYDERFVRRIYINEMTEPEATVVAGSSRGAQVSKAMLGLDDAFNLGVSGSTLEDIVGFYGLLDEKGMLPERLILVLDPWMFNDNFNIKDEAFRAAVGDGYYRFVTGRLGYTGVDPALLEIQPQYRADFSGRVGLRDLPADQRWNLFSLSYFQQAVSSLSRGEQYPWPVATDDDLGTNGLLRADLSFSYPKDYRETTVEQATQIAKLSFPESVLGLEDYTELDSNRMRLFRDFLQCARTDGVEVLVVMQPISPVIYDYMKDYPRYDTFFRLEPAIRNFCAENGVPYFGSFDPAAFGFDMSAFYDGYHVKAEYLEQILLPVRNFYEQENKY